jgi:SAM-dependent methyltransferase
VKAPDTTKICQPWPEGDLENVGCCPYCSSTDRTLAYENVQDWTFYCAPGKWAYWECKQCSALYLNPRPTITTIGKAYGAYYTHKTSLSDALKNIIRNACLDNWFGKTKTSSIFGLLLAPLRAKITIPFYVEALAQIPVTGRLADVGCGDGTVLEWASKSGWSTVGLEIDPNAVVNARRKGLDVIEGGYGRLPDLREQFDCMICLHVIEHVHDPIDLLEKLKESLKPNGVLIIAAPNASSRIRAVFRECWRGLEAPRHLAIPDITAMKSHLEKLGFHSIRQFSNSNLTAAESSRIQRRDITISKIDRARSDFITRNATHSSEESDDIIQLICHNGPNLWRSERGQVAPD